MVAMVFLFCIVTPVTHMKFGAQAHLCGVFSQPFLFLFTSNPYANGTAHSPLPLAVVVPCATRTDRDPKGGRLLAYTPAVKRYMYL